MADTNPPADLLLDEAAALWACTRRGYRDGMLKVGDALHRFVCARLEAGRGMRKKARQAAGHFRSRAVADAAARLGCHVNKVNELLRAAAVVRLLGDPGPLSFSSLREMRPAVVRTRRGSPVCPGGRAAGAELEAWALAPGREEEVRGLWDRARGERWSSPHVAAALAGRGEPRERGPHAPRPTTLRGIAAGHRPIRDWPAAPAPERPAAPQTLLHVREPGRKASGCPLPEGLLSVARFAAPADLADLVEVLVSRSPDPPAAAALVAERMRGVRAAGPPRLSLAGVI